MYRTFALAVCITCIAVSAKAHEFWIDPADFVVPEGGQVVATLRVGEQFKGNSLAYIPPNIRRFEYVLGGEVAPVPGMIGDNPALAMTPPGTGLMVVVHVTADTILTWPDFERFRGFVLHKDAAWALDRYPDGAPEKEIREVYSRYAKSLVAVGDGEGEDLEAGLLTEIVALENPYTGDIGDDIEVRVLYEGAPRPGAQVEVFEKAGEKGPVAVFTVRTDAEGRATVPVKPGYRYMLDSVVLREASPEMAAKNVTWESLWANLTFAVPAR